MGESFDAGTLSRYDMSDSTYRQLQRDHIRFEEDYAEKFNNGFICRILINYMCYAQENFLERFESDIEKTFVNTEHTIKLKLDALCIVPLNVSVQLGYEVLDRVKFL